MIFRPVQLTLFRSVRFHQLSRVLKQACGMMISVAVENLHY